MRSIGVFAAPDKRGAQALLRQLISLAEAHSVTVKVQSGLAHAIGRSELGCASDDLIAQCDVLVTMSGDGGVLAAARAAAQYHTPVLAIDLGRLGFLSAVRPTELEMAFGMLLRDEFVFEERMMLDACVLRTNHNGDRTAVGSSIGLNDAVVAKSALARILHLTIYAGSELVAETRADGLIISTPTGSTAYALSAGGPIVHPDVPSLLICPICAHSLNSRPLVVDSHEVIEVQAEWEGDEVSSAELEAMLTVDGQVGFSLQSGDTVLVRRAAHTARLLQPPTGNFYDRLREKMRWGR